MVLPHFDDYLEKYANLLIKKGVNIQKGHTLLISIAVEQHKLARLLTKKAYEAGAAEVLVDYNDDQITREKLLKADEDRLLQVPDYVVEQSHYLLDQKASRLVIRSANPNVFADIDSDRLAGATRATAIALEKQRAATQANKVSWNLAAAAGPEWAAMVFPNLTSEEEQVDALWDAIFKMNRIYETDPVKAWDQHQERLEKKARLLNDYQFDSLHYRAPGTDLRLGMPEQHIWEAAGLNRSTAHADFMIGSEQMDIDGITKDGEVIPIFRGGEWAI